MAVERLAGFDYRQLEPDVRADVETATRRLHDLERRTSESIVEMGQQLILVKDRLGHGQFLPWLKEEFGWSRFTADNFMKVALLPNVENFNIYQPSALYVLASPSTPKDVRVEFTGLANIGAPIRHKDVKAAIAKYNAPTKPDPIPIEDWEADDGFPEVPYELVDVGSGEIFNRPSQNHGTSFSRPPAQITDTPYPTTEPKKQAGSVAARIRREWGNDMAVAIADAIYQQVNQ